MNFTSKTSAGGGCFTWEAWIGRSKKGSQGLAWAQNRDGRGFSSNFLVVGGSFGSQRQKTRIVGVSPAVVTVVKVVKGFSLFFSQNKKGRALFVCHKNHFLLDYLDYVYYQILKIIIIEKKPTRADETVVKGVWPPWLPSTTEKQRPTPYWSTKSGCAGARADRNQWPKKMTFF